MSSLLFLEGMTPHSIAAELTSRGIKVLKAQDGTISDFDGSLWGSMVEFVTVGRDKGIMVTSRNGTEIQAQQD